MFTPTHTQSRAVFTPKNLDNSECILMRNNVVKKSLSPNYSGLHKVMDRKFKCFTEIINGKPNTISVDQLKLAYVDLSY